MEPLYKTTTKYTYEEFKKFNNTIIFKNNILLISIALVIIILIGGILLQNEFLIIFGVIYPIFFVIAKNIGTKRVYNSNKIIQDVNVEFEFYEDHFEEKNSAGTSNIPYNKLNEIIETKTNFYLMISKNQGYMLIKENMQDNLEEFLRTKKSF